MKMMPAGDTALVVEFGTSIDPKINDQVVSYQTYLEKNPPPGVIELLPTYRSLMITYDPVRTNYQELESHLFALVVEDSTTRGKTVEIPVSYGDQDGPDLEAVAVLTGLTPARVIALHSQPLYRVYMIGFAPGFPYLGGLDQRLFVPRLKRPRTRIRAGSVAIGGEQTGIYPFAGPGGWRIIGRTELELFDVFGHPPARVQAGDRIRFVPTGGVS